MGGGSVPAAGRRPGQALEGCLQGCAGGVILGTSWPLSGIRSLAVGECVAEGGASEESGFRVSGGGSCS